MLFFQTTALLRGIATSTLEIFIPRLDRLAYDANQRVLAEGEPGDCLYLVLNGRLRAVTHRPDGSEALLNEIGVGETVGEIALLTGEPRTASVYASQPSTLLRMSRAQLDWLRERDSAAAEAITRAIVERLQRSQLNLALHASKLFEGLPEPVLQAIRSKLELRLLRGGETLVRQGEESDALYIAVNGRLRVVQEQEDGRTRTLYELRRGQSVGEIGIITGGPRIATVVAIRDSLVARLTRADFDQLLAAYPAVMLQQFAAPVLRVLGQQSAGVRSPGAVATIAVIPIGRAGALAEFATQLAEALAAAGPTLRLSSADLDTLIGLPGAAQIPGDAPTSLSLVRWLNEQEVSYSYVVYQADPAASHWTERCLRQADRVVLVADAGDDPALSALELALLRPEAAGHAAQRCLVLVHDPATGRPSGTRAWLEPRSVSAHYHIRRGDPSDMARLARLLTGRGVGVVLSGGGAPGFGHIGALRALREAGVPIDLIGGTSQGGVMACQYAMGWDDATTMAKNRAAVRHRFDYTFPITALMAGAEMTDAMREMFEDTQLEDLWLPCYCVSVNLSRAALAVHERGPVWKYTRATTSIPGVLPPVIDGGEMLVDGGLLNNLPTDIMRQREDCGAVIAIDANSGIGSVRDQRPPYETSLSGWRVLWQRLNPFAAKPRVPTMGNIMVRIAALNDAMHVKTSRGLADVYMRLTIGKYGLLEFRALEAIVAAGYQTASAHLAAIKDDPAFQALAGGSGTARNGDELWQ
jgi:predicted acylesterase/phospholipase RssA/CRP-like cAMP-binding protein